MIFFCTRGHGDGAPADRIATIGRLAHEASADASNTIAKAARDADPAVRRAAITALAGFAKAEHRPVVEESLASVDPSVRCAAAAGLGAYADQSAVERLSVVLAGDADEQVRFAAVAGLVRTRQPTGIVALVLALESNDNPNVRLRVLRMLEAQFKIRYLDVPAPTDAAWSRIVAKVRALPTVRDAFEAQGIHIEPARSL